jgi:hypothetical protein
MKYLFLDTNIFYNNWHMQSADFRFLFNYIDNTDSVLLMSELVCDEIENIRNRELEGIVSNLKQDAKRSMKYKSEIFEYDFDKLLTDEKYDFRLLIEEKVSNIEYFDYEKIEQKKVVQRALKKIRPFQEEEKGYRDTLIWLSFISYLADRKITNGVVFITNNKDDFYNKKNDDFHDDLKSDLIELNLKCEIVKYNSLFDFIKDNVDRDEHFISQTKLFDEHLNEIDDELESEAVDFINNLSESKFSEILSKNRLKTFPYINSLISHSIEIWEGVEDPEILYYKKLSKGSVYVSFRYNLRICNLQLSIPNFDYYSNRFEIDKLYHEIQSDENYTSLTTYVRAYLDVSFEYNMESMTIEGYNIEEIDFK